MIISSWASMTADYLMGSSPWTSISFGFLEQDYSCTKLASSFSSLCMPDARLDGPFHASFVDWFATAVSPSSINCVGQANTADGDTIASFA